MEINITTSFTIAVCIREGCGVQFAMPSGFITQRRKDHAMFYCPSGHPQYYSAENDAEKAKREKAEVERRLQAELNEAQMLQLVAERARDKAVRDKRKLEKRVKAGVCLCCNHAFKDITTHVGTKHKDFALPPAPMKQIESAKG